MKVLSILLLIFGLFVCAGAQTVSVDAEKSTIKGTVTDAGGAVIPGAKVSFTGKSGKIFSTLTNDKGFFRLEVKEGTYRVAFSGHGFATFKIEGYRVVSKTPMELDVALNVGGPSGPVRVEDPDKGEVQVFLTGTVYDPAGAVIPTTKVSARNSKGQTFEAVTAEDGSYRIGIPIHKYQRGIAVAVYEVTAERTNSGFKRTVLKEVKIAPSFKGIMQLDLVLEPLDTEPCGYGGVCPPKF